MDTTSEEKKKHKVVFEEHIRSAHDRFVAGFPRDGVIDRIACTMFAEKLIHSSASLAQFGIDPALIGDYAAAIARGALARAALEKQESPVSGETGA